MTDRPPDPQIYEMLQAYPLVWHWRKFLPDRKGRACRRICQGRNGNVLVEFVDGFRVVAPRHAVRRALNGGGQ